MGSEKGEKESLEEVLRELEDRSETHGPGYALYTSSPSSGDNPFVDMLNKAVINKALSDLGHPMTSEEFYFYSNIMGDVNREIYNYLGTLPWNNGGIMSSYSLTRRRGAVHPFWVRVTFKEGELAEAGLDDPDTYSVPFTLDAAGSVVITSYSDLDRAKLRENIVPVEVPDEFWRHRG